MVHSRPKNVHNIILLLLLFIGATSLSASLYEDRVFVNYPAGEPLFHFLPARETLQRVFSSIIHQEKGMYLSFSLDDVNTVQSNESLQKTLAINGKNVFKGVPLLCKGTHTNQKIVHGNLHADDCYERIACVRRYWGEKIQEIYSVNPLNTLAQYDINAAARLIRFIRSLNQCVLICSSEASHGAYTIFGAHIHQIIFDANIENSRDVVECECARYMDKNPNTYTIFLMASGSEGRVLGGRLYEKFNNVFVLDMASFIDDFSAGQVDYDISKMQQLLARNIVCLYTAAVIKNRADERKLEYLHSLQTLRNYWIDPYIVEACSKSPTFFDTITSKIFYSQVNNPLMGNKGVNEAASICEACKYYKFEDNDLIIKLTGRYYFKNDNFLRIIENFSGYDGYVVIDPRTHYSFSGCFGLRGDYFRSLMSNIDGARMNREGISLEMIVLNFMRKIEAENGAKILYLDELDVYANVDHTWRFHW